MLKVEPVIRAPAVDAMSPTWLRVQRARRETHDTFSLDLTAPQGELCFYFEPGQFNMLYTFGVGEVPISISSDPARSDRIVHTTRAVGAVTRAMARLGRGELLGVRGPFGTGWPIREARGKDVVIVAGGIGLAPLRPVIYDLLRHRDDFGRLSILYGARTPDDLLFRDELREWRGRLDLEVDVTVDRGVGRWRGNVGVVTTLIPRIDLAPDNALAMICGPEVMMRFTIQALGRRGVDTSRMYVSMERNMKCGIGLCGHCQFGSHFVCRDGPVYRFDEIEHLFAVREL